MGQMIFYMKTSGSRQNGRVMLLLQRLKSLWGILLILAGCSTAPLPPLSPDSKEPSGKRGAGEMKPAKIGLLLPLKGNHALLGRALQETAILAYLKELKNQPLTLIFEDTLGTPAGTKEALRRLVSQDVEAIIGPIFAEEVQAIRSHVAQKEILCFSLSNNPAVAGKNIVVMGVNPVDSIKGALVYATQQGVKSVLALLPQSLYGQQLRQHLPALVSGLGMNLRNIHMYSPHNPYDYTHLSFGEIDALILPESAPNTPRILKALFHHGVDLSRIKIIGSSAWENLSTRPEGSIFAGGDLEKSETVLKEFEAVYGKRPPRLALILYDTLFLISTLKQMHRHSPLKYQHLMQPQGFKGVQGVFTFTSSGCAVWEFNVYETLAGQLRKVGSTGSAS